MSEKNVKRLSNLVKPAGMDLEAWQRQLRRQMAEMESYEITDTGGENRPGYFSVKKTKSGKDYGTDNTVAVHTDTHEIVYRGEMSPWNYCSCMDFKTSGLGTCKHIEAVRLWMEENGIEVDTALPGISSLYIDYTDSRKVKLRIGSQMSGRVMKLASDYFDSEGVIYQESEEYLCSFLVKAKEAGLPVRCFPDVLEYVKQQSNLRRLKKLAPQITDELLDRLLKTKLYPYQRDGVRFAFEHGRSIIADEMGLGKTIQAIAVAELLRHFKLITSVLVVCPTSLKYQWKHEIEKFTDSTAIVIEGNSKRRLNEYECDDAFYKIVSYTAMSNDVRSLSFLSTDMLIMDEVQRLKNWDTNIARAARRLKFGYATLLSGTPLENRLEELYSIVELVDQYYLSPYYKFRDECIITDESGMTKGYKNLNRIGEKLRDIMIRRRKSDVSLQMPDRIDTTIYVPMTDGQRKIHDDLSAQVSRMVSKWRRHHFLSELDRRNLLITLNRMRMVANSTYILDRETRGDTKVTELLNILRDVMQSGDDKVVVFSTWERMTHIIATELDKMGVRYSNLSGSVVARKRKQLVDDFNNDPDCRVFLSTDAGSTGLNLQAGSVIVNMELPWNPAVLEQRIGRIYRLGQQRNVQVINFVSIDSIERQIESKNSFKTAMSEGILDEGYDEIFLTDDSKFDRIIAMVEDSAGTESREEASERTGLFDFVEDETSSPVDATATPAGPITRGVEWLTDLAGMLQSAEGMESLLDSLVRKDPSTGEEYLHIPVSGREQVAALLRALASLRQ